MLPIGRLKMIFGAGVGVGVGVGVGAAEEKLAETNNHERIDKRERGGNTTRDLMGPTQKSIKKTYPSTSILGFGVRAFCTSVQFESISRAGGLARG